MRPFQAPVGVSWGPSAGVSTQVGCLGAAAPFSFHPERKVGVPAGQEDNARLSPAVCPMGDQGVILAERRAGTLGAPWVRTKREPLFNSPCLRMQGGV